MKLAYLGLSRDGRTNRWLITCDCGAEIHPQTTIYANQQVVCEKCGAVILADYNSQTLSRVSDDKEQPCQN